MRYLLDTHVLIWSMDAASWRGIPGPVLTALADRRNDLLVSAVSPWEIAIKTRKGKLPEGPLLIATWPDTAERLCATVLPMTDRHGIVAGGLAWAHEDPFDRMLAAQAILENATLVTADRAFDEVPGLRRLWDDRPDPAGRPGE